MECVDKLIRPDMICPLSGKKLKESDIISIVRVSLLIQHFEHNGWVCLGGVLMVGS